MARSRFTCNFPERYYLQLDGLEHNFHVPARR